MKKSVKLLTEDLILALHAEAEEKEKELESLKRKIHVLKRSLEE